MHQVAQWFVFGVIVIGVFALYAVRELQIRRLSKVDKEPEK